AGGDGDSTPGSAFGRGIEKRRPGNGTAFSRRGGQAAGTRPRRLNRVIRWRMAESLVAVGRLGWASLASVLRSASCRSSAERSLAISRIVGFIRLTSFLLGVGSPFGRVHPGQETWSEGISGANLMVAGATIASREAWPT